MFFYIIQEIIVINKPWFRKEFSFYPVIIKQIDSIQMLSINILEILAQNSKFFESSNLFAIRLEPTLDTNKLQRHGIQTSSNESRPD